MGYPAVRRDDTVIEDHFGVKVADPYRWLEDPDSSETQSFVEAQNAISMPYLSNTPIRKKYNDRLTELYDYPKYSAPSKHGSRYFYFMNKGLQNQSVLYVQSSLLSDPEVFLDPNGLSEDGTTALTSSEFTEDGELVALSLSEKGSDWNTIKIKKVATKEDYLEQLKWVKFSSIAWTHDNHGFFYERYPEPDTKSAGSETHRITHQKVYFHKLGTPQSEDVLCYEDLDNSEWIFGCVVSDDGQYLVMTVSQGAEPRNKIYYSDLSQVKNVTGKLTMVRLIDDFSASWEYIANEGSCFTFRTNFESPNYRLVNIDINKPEKCFWKTVVAEHSVDVLQWAKAVHNDQLIICYLHDVKSLLNLHNLRDGALLTSFPLDIGYIVDLSGSRKDSEIFYHFTSFLTPGIIFHCDLTTPTISPEVFRRIEVKGFDASLYQVEQVFYESKDGTRVPMFITSKKGITLDGSHPVLLYGYGGFNISLLPYFAVSRIIFMQHLGGIVAIPNIRGGGEYGDRWHQAGIFERRQNAYDDFQAAAEYLIKNHYTSPRKLAIQGGSNGGLLVCVCANQRPDLFRCVLAQVGVLDLLRFHKFSIGYAWCTDYGDPDKELDFQWLRRFSPLHNIAVPPGEVQYPAVLLLTADHDDRVVPLHSYKFLAQLQYTMSGQAKQTNPLMIRIETKAGHGLGKPTSKIIEEYSDMYAFLATTLGPLEWID